MTKKEDNTWIAAQTWKNLLFAHYPVTYEEIRPLVPDCFSLDLYKNQAWVSIVPFLMTGIRLKYLPTLPFTPSFPELNLRTYITYEGEPGVYFFTMDAESKAAVAMAKIYNMPYLYAKMSYGIKNSVVEFKSERIDSRAKKGVFKATYQGMGDTYLAEPGSLEYWLTQRFLFFLENKGQVIGGRIRHRQWPLQKANVTIHENSLGESVGITLSKEPEIVGYCKEIHAVNWLPKRIGP
ncbi:DUF2071 domain-containing protein [Pullulanibacillus sp. KACC 23026]|uniref:YqjF family protein n=1 Tax=Pullulanibacillus sp. KACC 23026 TaxID=3028315 RepID=UPI0023AF3DB7|nr:DUF2071 domain-containing protein [Pullulanibacillus sp. KACC 23026]WEG12896.1 DUF2071 domain-containing protein [Pullulanibacillus sp. KACC 23026]